VGQLYISASEIEVFDLCPRKWAFGYVEGLRPPPNDSAALGTRVHAILEKWLKDGTPPDTWTPEGEIAASGLHFLPAPRTPTLVTEEKFHFASQRAWYTGFKDFRYRDANGLLHVGDHKTTKAFTWAKSLDEILCHSQALIYAVDEFRKNPNDDRLALDWIYYRTTGSRKAEPRFQIVSRQTVAELFFTHVDPVAGEITKLHHEVPSDASALDFTPDFRACNAFGGCPFLSICNPTPTQRVQATMTQAGMSLTDKLKAMRDGRPPSPIHPPEEFAARAQRLAPAPSVPALVAAPSVPFFSPSAPTTSMPSVPSFNLPVPSSQAAPAPLLAVVPPPQAVPAPSVPQAAPVAPAEPAPKKKRGRPKASAATSEAINAAFTPPVVAPVAGPAGFTLYVGCAPIGVPVTNALDYVKLAYDDVSDNNTPRELCDALSSVLNLCTADEAPSGDVVLGDTQIEKDTASVWLSRATKVVRAFR
jgi:hypothetical protein